MRKQINETIKSNTFNNRRREIQIEIAEIQQIQARNKGETHDAVSIMGYNIELLRMELNQQIQSQNHQLQRGYKHLAELMELYELCYIYAPFDGYITEIPRETFPGMRFDTRTVFLVITSVEDFVIEIRNNIGVFVYQTKYITHGLVNGHIMELDRIPPTPAEVYARTTRLRFAFQSQEDIKRAGEGLPDGIPLGAFVVITISQEHADDAIVIPINALYEDPLLGDYVYVRRDGVKYFQPVETGIRNAAEVQILSGLSEGEVVYVGNH
jgi:multidrug efflux pump subunit AcrA (membrane-fusion protein)